ncbi:hypothetical protein DENSPDRAFT_833161 [Dentipellis sp. KUC8613]|nr:hypothetical protein DENSPDRAFT_833161 [Dentipellis sp. KUC8613]
MASHSHRSSSDVDATGGPALTLTAHLAMRTEQQQSQIHEGRQPDPVEAQGS